MAVLLPPSTSHRQITAIHSAVTSGKRNKMSTQTVPPASTNGLRRPHLGLQVLSLVAPMNGWINNPVMGAAMLRMGRYSGFAPNRRKRGFTAVWVRPKLNWTPKNPRFIHAMLPAVINGRRASSSSTVFARTSAVSTAIKLSLGTPRARYSLRPQPLRRSTPLQIDLVMPGGRASQPPSARGLIIGEGSGVSTSRVGANPTSPPFTVSTRGDAASAESTTDGSTVLALFTPPTNRRP